MLAKLPAIDSRHTIRCTSSPRSSAVRRTCCFSFPIISLGCALGRSWRRVASASTLNTSTQVWMTSHGALLHLLSFWSTGATQRVSGTAKVCSARAFRARQADRAANQCLERCHIAPGERLGGYVGHVGHAGHVVCCVAMKLIRAASSRESLRIF